MSSTLQGQTPGNGEALRRDERSLLNSNAPASPAVESLPLSTGLQVSTSLASQHILPPMPRPQRIGTVFTRCLSLSSASHAGMGTATTSHFIPRTFRVIEKHAGGASFPIPSLTSTSLQNPPSTSTFVDKAVLSPMTKSRHWMPFHSKYSMRHAFSLLSPCFCFNGFSLISLLLLVTYTRLYFLSVKIKMVYMVFIQ